MTNIKIAIDGPASSGKSTIAKAVAKRLNIAYIDTGAMYRAVTLRVLEENRDIYQQAELEDLFSQLDIKFDVEDGNQRLILNGRDVSKEIRSTKVTNYVSEVSALDFVREQLVDQQRQIAQNQSVVMDGRDIGTVVLPDARYKFFFTASAKVRAERRYKENIENGVTDQSLEELTAAIIKRDEYDSNRKISPLRRASDAIVIDGTNMSVEEMIDAVMGHIERP